MIDHGRDVRALAGRADLQHASRERVPLAGQILSLRIAICPRHSIRSQKIEGPGKAAVVAVWTIAEVAEGPRFVSAV